MYEKEAGNFGEWTTLTRGINFILLAALQLFYLIPTRGNFNLIWQSCQATFFALFLIPSCGLFGLIRIYYMGRDEMDKLMEIDTSAIKWKSIKKEGLDLDYAVPIHSQIAKELFNVLEDTLEYFTGDLSKTKVFGKVYPLPRKQVAYGNPGITYTYSGKTIPALPWPKSVLALRNFIASIKGIEYDFVLVNKYRNGHDHMGEHRDNEPDLDPNYPIASVSLGQERPFILKHKDARKPGKVKKKIPTVKINLENGSILFMNPPTNEVWYHSLPTRKKLLGARINLTFRKMRVKSNK